MQDNWLRIWLHYRRTLNPCDTQNRGDVAITAAFGQEASNAWGTYTNQKAAELKVEAWRETDPQRRQALLDEADKWSEGGAYHLAGHTLLGALSGDVSSALGNSTSVAVMSELGSRIDELNLPDAVKSGLNASLAAGIGYTTGGSQGAAQGYTSELNNRQLHDFEQTLAEQLAENSPYTAEEIANALRGMNKLNINGEGDEHPGFNIIVDSNNPELEGPYAGYAAERFDEGGTWVETAEGVYVQVIPRSLDADLVNYIISTTGGETSVYSLPVFESTGEIFHSYLRDPITGVRVVDENGQLTVNHVIDGRTYTVKHWPCHTSNTGCEGSVPDPSSPGYEAWQTAVNAKALDDLATFGTLVGLVPGLGYATAVSIGTTGADLIAHYLREESFEGLSKEAMAFGFESYAQSRGLSVQQARQLTNAISLLGVWDTVYENGRKIINE